MDTHCIYALRSLEESGYILLLRCRLPILEMDDSKSWSTISRISGANKLNEGNFTHHASNGTPITMPGTICIYIYMTNFVSCLHVYQVLWNPRWTKGLGLTGGEEHEQVFSELYRYAYVLKHMSTISKIA